MAILTLSQVIAGDKKKDQTTQQVQQSQPQQQRIQQVSPGGQMAMYACAMGNKKFCDKPTPPMVLPIKPLNNN